MDTIQLWTKWTRKQQTFQVSSFQDFQCYSSKYIWTRFQFSSLFNPFDRTIHIYDPFSAFFNSLTVQAYFFVLNVQPCRNPNSFNSQGLYIPYLYMPRISHLLKHWQWQYISRIIHSVKVLVVSFHFSLLQCTAAVPFQNLTFCKNLQFFSYSKAYP